MAKDAWNGCDPARVSISDPAIREDDRLFHRPDNRPGLSDLGL